MRNLLFIFLFAASQTCTAQDSLFHVYLIGDAGEDTVPGKALKMLEEKISGDRNSSVIFLGDNAYPSGLTGKNEARLNLNSQLKVLENYKGQVYFIPGNHDWQAQKRRGREVLKKEEDYVNEVLQRMPAEKGSGFLPANGSPGPVAVSLSAGLRLIIIDTQWFLHLYKKNYSGTKRQAEERFFYSLDSLLARSKEDGEQVIIAAHHPLYSNGQHAKPKQPWRFLVNYTPFQIFGLLGLNRLYSQDLDQPRYHRMRRRLLKSVDAYDNIIYAAGHEHNIQYFYEKKNHFFISGAGSKLTKLRKRKRFKQVFENDQKLGFIRLTFNGNTLTEVKVELAESEPVVIQR
jgi:hypothetical protein